MQNKVVPFVDMKSAVLILYRYSHELNMKMKDQATLSILGPTGTGV